MRTLQRVATVWLDFLRSQDFLDLVDRTLEDWLEAISPELYRKSQKFPSDGCK